MDSKQAFGFGLSVNSGFPMLRTQLEASCATRASRKPKFATRLLCFLGFNLGSA